MPDNDKDKIPEPSGAETLSNEASDSEVATRKGRSTETSVDEPTKFPAGELMDLTVKITDGKYRRSYAAGALKHAGIERTEYVSKERFLQVLDDYVNVPAFSGGSNA